MTTDRAVYLLRSVYYAGQIRRGETRMDGEVVECGETLVVPVSFAAELVNARKATYVEETAVMVSQSTGDVDQPSAPDGVVERIGE